jgi:uncharacterized protein (DUF2147 family)
MLLMLPARQGQAANPPPTVVGLWRVMDGSGPGPLSLVALSERDGVVSGTVMRVLRSSQGEHPVCQACKGPRHNQAVVGMTVVWGLKQEGDKPVWAGGSVLDPGNGQTYKCKVTLRDANTLEMRGYLGISLLGRTQVWHRADPGELTAALPAPAAKG